MVGVSQPLSIEYLNKKMTANNNRPIPTLLSQYSVLRICSGKVNDADFGLGVFGIGRDGGWGPGLTASTDFWTKVPGPSSFLTGELCIGFGRDRLARLPRISSTARSKAATRSCNESGPSSPDNRLSICYFLIED
jgi:hypothetical protein